MMAFPVLCRTFQLRSCSTTLSPFKVLQSSPSFTVKVVRRCYTRNAEKTTASLGDPLTFPTSKRTAKNRFLKAALSERLAIWEGRNSANNGIVTNPLINLYSKWGHGGWGVLLTSNIMVDAMHLESAGNMIIERKMESGERRKMLQKLATVSKADGALAVVQLGHAGRQTPMNVNASPFSASDVRLTGGAMGPAFGQPVGLTLEQIKTEVIDKFVYAAKYCASVGFDGIQLHGAHGYLLSQFMSPTTNKRTDKYGGSVENRARIVLEIYEEIRKVVPSDFVIGLKMNSVEFQKDGLLTEEATTLASLYEQAGMDFIELSGGTYESLAFTHRRESTLRREAFFFEFSEAIMKRLQKSVVYLTGGFRTAHGMMDAIRNGATHGIGIGRPASQELDFAKRFVDGTSTEAHKCLVSMDDFVTGLFACQSQFEQAGRSLFSGDTNVGIMDLGDEKTVARYKEALQRYLLEWRDRLMKGEAVHGALVFP